MDKLEVMEAIMTLDIEDKAYVMVFLAQQLEDNVGALRSELTMKNACIRAALKINKNEAVANLLEEDE